LLSNKNQTNKFYQIYELYKKVYFNKSSKHISELNTITHDWIKSWVYTDIAVYLKPYELHKIDDYIGFLSELFMEKYQDDFGEYPNNWWEN